jgi:hypothetical protein
VGPVREGEGIRSGLHINTKPYQQLGPSLQVLGEAGRGGEDVHSGAARIRRRPSLKLVALHIPTLKTMFNLGSLYSKTNEKDMAKTMSKAVP